MPPQPSGPKAPVTIYLAALIAVMVIAGALAWYWFVMRTTQPTIAEAQQASDTFAQTQVDSATSIQGTSNPVKDATPAVNPVESANPFNDATSTNSPNNDYQNPFQ